MVEIPPKNASILEPLNLVDGVTVRALWEDGIPRIQMLLVIDEYTNYDSISKNRKMIKGAFEFINTLQGSNLNVENKLILYALIQWLKEHIGGLHKLMMVLNYLAFVLTLGAYDEGQKNRGETAMQRGESQELISDPSFISSAGGYGLITIFLALGKTIEDFNLWMEQGYEFLAEDRFDAGIIDEPFSKSKIRNKIRYFQDIMDEGIITIPKEDLHYNALEHLIYVMDLKGYFSKMDELLDKRGSKDWKKNKGFLQGWVVMVSKKWEESQDPKTVRMREIFINLR